MDATLKANWQQPVSTHFTAIEIVLPESTLRLVSGGFVSFAVDGVSQAFIAEDDIYGALGAVEVIKDGIEAVAMSAVITLLPPTDTALADLAAPQAQGSMTRIWQGAVDQTTGLAAGVPELLFTGELDFGTLTVTSGGWTLSLECTTEEARQLEPDSQRRLSDPFHQKVWPGELGMKYVSDTRRKIYWRLQEPRGQAGSSSGTRGATTSNYRSL